MSLSLLLSETSSIKTCLRNFLLDLGILQLSVDEVNTILNAGRKISSVTIFNT